MGASTADLLKYPLPEGCTLRFIQDGDEEGMLDVLDRAFDGWPKKELLVSPLEHLRWKLSSHKLAQRFHVVAELNGRIIAVRTFLARRIKVGDRFLLIRTAVDRAVLPEFQRRNIMNAMEVRVAREWLESFDALLSLRNNWQSVRAVSTPHHRRTIDVISRPLDSAPAAEAPDGWTLRRVDAFDARIDEFWREASKPYRLIVARTKDYLNYRYADRRAGNYTIVLAERAESVLGYIITAAWQGTGHIADVLVSPGRLDVLASLLADAVQRLRAAGNATVECWRFAYHPYVPVLEELGFVESRRTHGLSLAALGASDDELAFFADPKVPAHFSAGDTDLV